MIHRSSLTMLLMVLGFFSACEYKKGDMYTSALSGDSLNYVILAKGSGKKISMKASEQKLHHEFKGNPCQITYLTDSADLNSQQGILLFNSSLPDINNDMLEKGFIGTFTSRQNVRFLLISDADFKLHFRKTGIPKRL